MLLIIQQRLTSDKVKITKDKTTIPTLNNILKRSNFFGGNLVFHESCNFMKMITLLIQLVS